MKQTLLITILSLILVFSFSKSAVAQTGKGQAKPVPKSVTSSTDGCTFTGEGDETCKLENPIGETEVTGLIRRVIVAVLGIIGALTLLMFVWGGFQWLTSAGNPEKVSAGTQTMVWAVIGVLIVLFSYVLLSTFLNFLTTGHQ